jgi:hypothetical protein
LEEEEWVEEEEEEEEEEEMSQADHMVRAGPGRGALQPGPAVSAATIEAVSDLLNWNAGMRSPPSVEETLVLEIAVGKPLCQAVGRPPRALPPQCMMQSRTT